MHKLVRIIERMPEGEGCGICTAQWETCLGTEYSSHWYNADDELYIGHYYSTYDRAYDDMIRRVQ